MGLVNHQHLRAFHAVASEGSFSRAARRLNISQPTLSQQIKALETRHRAQLFEGRRRPLQLTPIGYELLQLTRRMFATSEEIETLLDERVSGEGQRIRLVSDSPVHAARMAQTVMHEAQGIEVEVQIDNSRNTLARILDARADVAIISDPQIDPRLFYRPLFVDALSVVVAAHHPLAGARVFPLERIAQECLLVREMSSKTRGAMESLLGAHDITPHRKIELHSRETIREAVALGLGVSLFFASECPPDTRLSALMPDAQPDPTLLTNYFVCRSEQRRSGLMRMMLQAVDRMVTPPGMTRLTAGAHGDRLAQTLPLIQP
jgi:LysR family transcriptional regulator, low CO2-responsive transcriptional regulator